MLTFFKKYKLVPCLFDKGVILWRIDAKAIICRRAVQCIGWIFVYLEIRLDGGITFRM